MRKSWKKMLSAVLTLSMVLALLPVTALAEGEAEEAMCTCTALCTEETVNMECAVCGTGGACGFVVPVDATAPAEEMTPVETETPAEEPAPVEPETPAEEPAPVEPETPAAHEHTFGAWDYDVDNDSFFRVCDADDETETSEMPDAVAKLAEDVQAAADLEEAEAIIGKAVEDGAILNGAASYLMNLVGAYEVETQADAVAEVGGQQYATLKEAIAAVPKDGTKTTITLLSNAEITGYIELAGKVNIVIDMGNEYKLTLTSTGTAITIKEGAALEFLNGEISAMNITKASSAAITIEEGSSITLNGIIFETSGVGLYPRGNAASVTVENSKIKAKNSFAVSTNAATNDNHKVQINLNNSEFIGKSPILINVPCELNMTECSVNGSMHGVIVRGGTAYINDCTIAQSGSTADAASMAGYFDNKMWGQGNTVNLAALTIGNKHETSYQYSTYVKMTGTTLNVTSPLPAVYAYANKDAENGVTLIYEDCTINGDVVYGNNSKNITVNNVEMNGKYYTTLQAAIDAAGAEETTITLVNNVDENVVIAAGQNITLDLNGKTLDGGTTASKAALTNYGTAVITDSKTGGTIKRSDNGPDGCYYTIFNEGTMTIKDGKVYNQAGAEPPTWSGASLICNGANKTATLTIEGGTISQDKFIAVKNDEHGTLSVTGGVIESKTQAVQNWKNATISGGDLTGEVMTCAYLNVKGTATISDNANINGNVKVTWYRAGSYEATVVPEVTITGGKITGDLLKMSTTDGTSATNQLESATNEKGKITVTGGHFTSDPTDYKANDVYVVESNESGYSFTVTKEKPAEAPIIVTEDVKASVDSGIPTSEADAIKKVIGQSEASGVADALKTEAKQNILADAKAEVSEDTALVEIEISVTVKATGAKLSDTEAAENFVAYEVTPVATVFVDGTEKATNIDVPNSYLNGNKITVKLPIPEGLNVEEVKHTCDDGSVEYFYKEGGNKNFTIENGLVVVEITKFSEIRLSGTVTAVAKADGVGYATLQEAVDAVKDGGTLEILADDLSAKVTGKKTFTVTGVGANSAELKAGSGYRLYDNDDGTYTVKKKKKKSSSSSDTSDQKYAVSIDDVDNGKVKVDPSKAEEDEKVTITVTPDKGYEIDRVKVTDKDGDKIDIKDKGNGKYTFTMPDSKVEVKVTFEKAKETPAEIEDSKKIILTIDERAALVFGETKINDVAPVIRSERTMLPIRFVVEALGGSIAWNATQRTVTIVKDDTVMVIAIGAATASVNGQPVLLDAPAFIENSRTYLPLRFVAENLDAQVTWDAETRQVIIIPNEYLK